jgi:long-chain acyl-CoA synthetase
MMSDSIARMIEVQARRFGAKPALSLHGSTPAEHYSYETLDLASCRLACALVEAGVQPGDRIALLSESRPRWGVAFFATLRAGGVVLPLDVRLSVPELTAILADARPRVLLVGKAQEALAAELLTGCGDKVTALSLEPCGGDTAWPSMDALPYSPGRPCVPRATTDAAVITFTSGTMGNAKGVVTTCGNLLFQVRAIRAVMQNDDRVASVSILPLSHLFELTAGFLGILHGGGHIRYCNSLLPVEVIDAMHLQRVTCMVVVPLFLELIKSAIRGEAARRSPLKRGLFAVTRRLALLLPLPARRRIHAPIYRRFGGRLEYFVCGGAPLGRDTRRFFSSIGLPVYQGYGLAETSPVIATNAPLAARDGSVGRPLPGVEVTISARDGGEILTRGPHVMRGYLGNRELTASLIDADGWLHTGDIGYLDADGFLYVTGRNKNTIVLGSGKKVQPEELEAVLFDDPDVREGCVIGMPATRGILKDSEEVCAIVVASDDAIRRCAQRAEDLELTLRGVVERRALSLAPFKRPTRIIVCRDPLPRTATRKVRRPQVRYRLSHGPVPS